MWGDGSDFSQFQITNSLFCSFNEFIFLLLGILILTILLLKSVKSEISLNEVKSMRIKQGFYSNNFLDIKLVNNRLRRVFNVKNAKELEKYIATNYDFKWNYGLCTAHAALISRTQFSAAIRSSLNCIFALLAKKAAIAFRYNYLSNFDISCLNSSLCSLFSTRDLFTK